MTAVMVITHTKSVVNVTTYRREQQPYESLDRFLMRSYNVTINNIICQIQSRQDIEMTRDLSPVDQKDWSTGPVVQVLQDGVLCKKIQRPYIRPHDLYVGIASTARYTLVHNSGMTLGFEVRTGESRMRVRDCERRDPIII